MELSCGKIQVSKLCLKALKFDRPEIPDMMQEFATNSTIKCLDLSGGTVGRDNKEYKYLCKNFLLENGGPSELIMDMYGQTSNTETVTEAFQQNTSVSSLTIGSFDDNCLSVFAKGLATMTGLRKLSFRLHEQDKDLEKFFYYLVTSLERNTTLQTLTFSGINPNHVLFRRYVPYLRYFLAINRIGRQRLFTETVPVGLWPHVLAKTSNEPAGINFVLRGMPEIVAPSRKRKNCHGDDYIFFRPVCAKKRRE